MKHDLLRLNLEHFIGEAIGDEVFDTFSKLMFKKTIEKKVYLAEINNPCKYVYFILQGA